MQLNGGERMDVAFIKTLAEFLRKIETAINDFAVDLENLLEEVEDD